MNPLHFITSKPLYPSLRETKQSRRPELRELLGSSGKDWLRRAKGCFVVPPRNDGGYTAITYPVQQLGCFFLSLLLFTLSSFCCFSQQPGTGETKVSLNGNWAFKTDPNQEGEGKNWFAPEYPAAGWETMPVPGNWDTRNEYAHFAGKGWYRKTVNVPADWQGKTVRLHFEAVYHDSKIWLNGKLLGESHSGFFPFEFDVTKDVKLGSANVIVVCADNTFRRGAIWNWGGIRRPVSLLVNNPLRIERTEIVATPDLKKGTATVAMKLLVRNQSTQTQTAKGTVSIQSLANKTVIPGKNLTFSATIPAGAIKQVTLQQNLTKAQTQLWHFDHPNLYQFTADLTQNGQLQHQITDRFGIRKVEIDGLQVKLNGEPVRLMGYNWVPDDRTTGNTLPAWRYKEDIDLMKRAGANMARLSHLPLPNEVLDYVDEKGMLVFSEIPLWGQDALVDPDNPLPKQWLKTLVHEQFNHPSVIGWCVGNEIGFLHANPKVMEYVESAVKYVKSELDRSRLVVYVSHSVDKQTTDPVAFSDMILFNKYGDLGKNADKAHSNHPGKPVFYSEYGYNLTNENPNLGVIDATKMLTDIRGRDYLMGGSLWTFNDYRSLWQAHAAWNTSPTGNRAWGMVDVFRQPKRAYEVFRREYAPVKGLNLMGEIKPGTPLKATVTVQPRTPLDLPAFTLEGYQLLWEAKDHQGKTLQGDFTNLPRIRPGDKPLTLPLSGDLGQSASLLKLTLLSPTGYDVYDTIVYFQKPSAPKIQAVITGESGVRVLFEPVANAQYYVVKYGQNDFGQRSDTTINPYVDLKKLTTGQKYQFQVVGLNALGEGAPSQTLTATPDTDLLPPVILATEAADSSFFISYGYENFDYLYKIRYGTQKDQPDTWKSLEVTTKGVCRIPNLENGKTYYFQMRRTVQQYVQSEWSEVHSVTPDGQQVPATPVVQGVTRNGSQAMVALTPVEKATGYVVHYQEEGREKTVPVDGAQSRYIMVRGLKPGQNYTFTVTAVNANGTSPRSVEAAAATAE